MPNTPLNKEDERERIIESLGSLIVVGKTPHHIRHFLGYSSLGAIADFILADRNAAIREANTWWITTGLNQNGKKLLGPFATRDLALSVRTYMEIAEAPATYWVEQSQPNAKEE